MRPKLSINYMPWWFAQPAALHISPGNLAPWTRSCPGWMLQCPAAGPGPHGWRCTRWSRLAGWWPEQGGQGWKAMNTVLSVKASRWNDVLTPQPFTLKVVDVAAAGTASTLPLETWLW